MAWHIKKGNFKKRSMNREGNKNNRKKRLKALQFHKGKTTQLRPQKEGTTMHANQILQHKPSENFLTAR